MSKEVTPKESLQIIQDNITPRTLGILTVEFNVVKQALDRLEQLENENKKWHEIVGCDLCDALGREILLEENKKLKKENQELENKNAALKIKVKAWEIQGKKFEKVIEILKKYLYLVMDNSGFIINTDGYLLKEEYDLLKEMLEL